MNSNKYNALKLDDGGSGGSGGSGSNSDNEAKDSRNCKKYRLVVWDGKYGRRELRTSLEVLVTERKVLPEMGNKAESNFHFSPSS